MLRRLLRRPISENDPAFVPNNIPDAVAYRPYRGVRAVFHPWLIDKDIAGLMRHMHERGSTTLVDWDRMATLKWGFEQTAGLAGEVWELGVYRGGSALFLKRLMEKSAPPHPALRLFDSFEGLSAPVDGVDTHKAGEFNDTSLDEVRALVGTDDFIDYRAGWVPDTFSGLGDKAIRFAHIDLDLYQPILDAANFVYERLVPGGVIVFDDYGFNSCPGARRAIDECFANRLETPLALPTGQALVVRRA